MKPTTLAWIVLLSVIAAPAQAGLNVFACEPEWASLMSELGGGQLNIVSATTALQDPHRIEARPSLIAKMRRADLVVCTGAELEVGWLPLLLRSSGNSKVQVGRPGYVEVAMLVERLEVPESLDRSKGDLHASGNPHVHLDPRRVAMIAEQLSRKLAELDAANAAYYQQRAMEFLQRWRQHLAEWQRRGAKLKGMRAVAHHKDWVYLFDWLGVEEVATLEAKPGVPPSPGYLAQLKNQLAITPASVVVRAAYQNESASLWLEKNATIRAIELPYTVGGSDEVTDLFQLMDVTLNRLLKAVP
ncbi:metal ABC transporter substrate-binding protein [Kaarinaea lacus]